MRTTRWWLSVCGGLWCLVAGAGVGAFALEPYAGVDVGMAAPTEKFRRTADVGGMLALRGGMRLFSLADSFTFSLELSPQFTAMPLDQGISTKGRNVQSVFSLTAGPRFALYDEYLEVSLSSGGGYYTHTFGVIDDDGGGWYLSGALQYRLGNGNYLGVFARRDEAHMRPVKGPSTDLTTYFTGGLTFQHVFSPAGGD